MKVQSNVYNIMSFVSKGWEKEYLYIMTSLAQCIYGRRYKKHDVDCFMFGDQVWRTFHGILFGNAWVLDCLNMFLMKNKEIKLRINVLV